MAVSEHTIVIHKPIDYVFRNMTCMRGCVNWLTSIVEAEKIGDEPVHVGTQYKETFKFMGQTGQTVITIQSYNPPYEFGFDDPVAGVAFHYSLEEVSGGTLAHVQLTLNPRDTGKVDSNVFTASVAKLFEHDLQNLKVMLESDVEVRVID
jgi:hypothetical protein